MTTSDADSIREHWGSGHGRAVRTTTAPVDTDPAQGSRRASWIVALVGPPGAGKGTQAAWLTRAMGLATISTGDRTELLRLTQHARGLAFDGFPRTLRQALLLEEALHPRAIDVVIDLTVTIETIRARLAHRCRGDDARDTLGPRLQAFDYETRPVIEHFRARGIVISVDGNRPPALVHRAITESLGRLRARDRTRARVASDRTALD